MNYFCCTDTRRNAVIQHPELNGIDFLEVLDNESDPFGERQTTLFVHFLKPLLSGALDVQNFKIKGGERITDIEILEVTLLTLAVFPSSPPEGADKTLLIRVSEAGDFSTYSLCLRRDAKDPLAPEGFDPVLSTVDFSFKVSCPDDFDCKTINECASDSVALPEISYLAKDYDSFRQLMLDRMSLLMPDWTERNPADLGITLVELSAYIADFLSYRQDAIATEAYLSTARKRNSVKRHARLVDYFMHDGCNARTWIHIHVGPGVSGVNLAAEINGERTKILSNTIDLSSVVRMDSKDYENALKTNVIVFELMHDLLLYTDHNEMNFYTWGRENCCLPKGATKATLLGAYPGLKEGDVLIFCEKRGPETGVEADANPTRRHAVKLIKVSLSFDPLFEAPDSPSLSTPAELGLPVTDIEWSEKDELPFPFCISSSNKNGPIENVSIAMGNNVLSDHGITIIDAENESSLEPSVVPESKLQYSGSADSNKGFCEKEKKELIPARYNPQIKDGPLTQSAPFDITKMESAKEALYTSARTALPSIHLKQTDEEGELSIWRPQRDLLNSSFNSNEFVVEIDVDGITHIRFGDNIQGERPAKNTSFKSVFRKGHGTEGNIGAGVLKHLVINDATIIANMPEEIASIWNPLPAFGGSEAETMEEVRQYAPEAFRVQERAVTAKDYEELALRCDSDIQRANATFRWTGSWKTVFVTIDRFGGASVDQIFENKLRECLEKYRMAGFDLEVDAPEFVSLEIKMTICVKQKFFASDVKIALLEVFSNRVLTDNQRGIFHPDNFSFGQTVYLSQLYAAAQAIQGVEFVQINKFQRQGIPDDLPLEEGKLVLGRKEIARCDNDPNFPERGLFILEMEGGR